MKDFILMIKISLIIPFMLLSGVASSDITWDLGDYTFHVYQNPQAPKDEGKMTPFITATLDKTTEGESVDDFGIVFNHKEGDTFWVYEIFDVDSNKIVKQVTLNEMLGLKKDQGCELISNEQPDAKTIIARYKINPKGYDLTLSRIIKLIPDPNVPKGNKVIITFDLANNLSGTPKLRFTERHRNDDYAFSEKTNVLYTVNKQGKYDGFPILVQAYTPEPASLSSDNEPKESNFSVSAVTWKPIIVQKKFNRPNVEVGRITVAVANFVNASSVTDQAKNIANYLISGNLKPQLSVIVEVDIKEAYPGDILTYQLICFNIGTGKAVDGSILDPIPSSVEYVSGSASGEGTNITYSVNNGNTFQEQPSGNVTHIKWDVVKPIEAGNFIKALFQAKVKEKLGGEER